MNMGISWRLSVKGKVNSQKVFERWLLCQFYFILLYFIFFTLPIVEIVLDAKNLPCLNGLSIMDLVIISKTNKKFEKVG